LRETTVEMEVEIELKGDNDFRTMGDNQIMLDSGLSTTKMVLDNHLRSLHFFMDFLLVQIESYAHK
jgi:hypothetical protein